MKTRKSSKSRKAVHLYLVSEFLQRGRSRSQVLLLNGRECVCCYRNLAECKDDSEARGTWTECSHWVGVQELGNIDDFSRQVCEVIEIKCDFEESQHTNNEMR